MGKSSSWSYSRTSAEISTDITKLTEQKQNLISVSNKYTDTQRKLVKIRNDIDNVWETEAAQVFKRGLDKQIKSVEKLAGLYSDLAKIIDKRLNELEDERKKAHEAEVRIEEIMAKVKQSIREALGAK
ncbi:MAG: hypothetical protein K6E26_10585 [Clostridiales bacterium]|nr:hypothetical protein [Clostridiales bacterium]